MNLKKFGLINIFVLVSILLFLTSCEAIKDIFKAGFWAGVIAVVLVIALVIFVIKKIF